MIRAMAFTLFALAFGIATIGLWTVPFVIFAIFFAATYRSRNVIFWAIQAAAIVLGLLFFAGMHHSSTALAIFCAAWAINAMIFLLDTRLKPGWDDYTPSSKHARA